MQQIHESLKKPTKENKERYKNYSLSLKKICSEAKTKYFQELINNSKSSVKCLWDTIGNMITKNMKKRKNQQ